MTIHCAMTYFDIGRKEMGYLLGSDRSANLDGIEYQVEKSFRGHSFMGVIRGILSINGNDPDSFSRSLNTLDNIFDGIDEEVDYSNVSLLKDSRYTLLIAGKNSDSLGLFTVSSYREEREKHKAERLHRITPESFYSEKGTKIWFSPSTSDYLIMASAEKWTLESAIEKITRLINGFSEMDNSIENGLKVAPFVYQVGFGNIGRIDV